MNQFNLEHGDSPKSPDNKAVPPPPPKARFRSETNNSVRSIQAKISEISNQLAEELENEEDGENLSHRAIVVKHQSVSSSDDDQQQSIIQEQFDTQADDAQSETSEAAYGSDTSSQSGFDFADLDLYDQAVNC